MVGRDWGEGASFPREGKIKFKEKKNIFFNFFCKGGCIYFCRRRRGKKKRKNPTKTKKNTLLFRTTGLWSQAGSAWKSRPTARPCARPGRGCAAAGVKLLYIGRQTNKQRQKTSLAREASASLERVSPGKPSAGFSPPGGKCRGWPPEGWVHPPPYPAGQALTPLPRCATAF